MAIENSVSNDFVSTFVDSINVFECAYPVWILSPLPDHPCLLLQSYEMSKYETCAKLHWFHMLYISSGFITLSYKSYFTIALNGYSRTEMKQDSEIDLEQKRDIIAF